MKVQFHDFTEFEAEIKADLTKVERNIVRVTIMTKIGDLFTEYYLCCSAIIAGRVVECREKVRDSMTHSPEERSKAFRIADKATNFAGDALRKLGLEVRLGVFVEAGEGLR